jgi:ferredoxin-NADP reductase
VSATAWLDRITGRVTMYRLMTIVLGAIAALAIVLSLIPGGLAFSPPALLASLAVALVVTYGSGRLFGMLFRTTAHGESSVITGLLIFFLFFPSTSIRSLLVLALISIIASISKYVLAIRGRHVFNPVAIAAVIIGFTQLSAAVWWVATPYLLIPVALGAFLIVYRARRFALIGVFLLIALLITLARLMLGGADGATALSLAIGSAPLVFFAGFMLDEPQTLPPLRWQQLLFAALVGVLYSVPFSVGPLYTTPELALVVGNILAFAFGQRRSIPLDFVSARQLTPTTRELTFAPTRRVSFKPGQYMELSLPHAKADARGVRRTFSLASAPSSTTVSFGIRIPKTASTFKRSLGQLQPGTRLRATSIGGDFTLPRNTTTPLLLVAGGIGITPFISQLAHLTASGEHRDVVLVYAVRDNNELAYADELETSGIDVLVLAPTRPTFLPHGWDYLGSGRLDTTQLAEHIPRLTARAAYVSGPPSMVTSLRRDLKALGLRHVRTDYFSGY